MIVRMWHGRVPAEGEVTHFITLTFWDSLDASHASCTRKSSAAASPLLVDCETLHGHRPAADVAYRRVLSL